MKKIIIVFAIVLINWQIAIAQVPVLTSNPVSVSLCSNKTANFNFGATNSPTMFGWECSNNGGDSWTPISAANAGSTFSNYNTATLSVALDISLNGLMVRGYAANASGASKATNAATATVVEASPVSIEKITSGSFCVGKNFQFAASPAGGSWSSKLTNIAEISCCGISTIKTKGDGVIKYSYEATNGCISEATYSINATQVTIPAINGASTVCMGANTTLTHSLTGGKWSSLNNRADVNSSGVVTGASSGNASIQYVATDADGCVGIATKTIAVVSLPNIPTIQYAAGTANPQVGAGGAFCMNRIFTVVGIPSGGIWSSTGVITVDSITGLVNTGTNTGAGTLSYVLSNGTCTNKRSFTGTVISCSRGVNATPQVTQSTNQQFTMYPNPARSFINLQVDKLLSDGTIIVSDLYGKEIKKQGLNNGSNTVDIANLTKGIYLISIITNEGKTTKKLVIE